MLLFSFYDVIAETLTTTGCKLGTISVMQAAYAGNITFTILPHHGASRKDHVPHGTPYKLAI